MTTARFCCGIYYSIKWKIKNIKDNCLLKMSMYLSDIFNKQTTMVRSSAAFNVWNMELLIMKGKIKNSFLLK